MSTHANRSETLETIAKPNSQRRIIKGIDRRGNIFWFAKMAQGKWLQTGGGCNEEGTPECGAPGRLAPLNQKVFSAWEACDCHPPRFGERKLVFQATKNSSGGRAPRPQPHERKPGLAAEESS